MYNFIILQRNPYEMQLFIIIYTCTIYKLSDRALSVYTDASRRRAAICTDKARSRGL